MKNFLEAVTGGISKTVDYVVEKNRKAALINRVKTVIRSEERNMERAYMELGRYYYRTLRDPENKETEHFCRAVDHSSQRIDRAVTKLEELSGEDSDEGCASCAGCDACGEGCDSCMEDGADEIEMEEGDAAGDGVSEEDLDDLRKIDGADGADEPDSSFPYDV